MKTLLIRAEDKNRWERRAPVVPADLEKILSDTGAKAFVEKSDKRFFSEDQYTAAGAVGCEGMADGDVIIGVKEIPLEKLFSGQDLSLFLPHHQGPVRQHAPAAKNHRQRVHPDRL